MENIKKINFDKIEFTVVNWKGEWCYIASEVCNYLEYPNLSKTLKDNVDDENKIKITKNQWKEFINTNNISEILFKDNTLNNQKLFSQGDKTLNNQKLFNQEDKTLNISEIFNPGRAFYLIKELGMYELIMRSQKPKAKDFQKFVYNMIKQLREDTGLEAYQALLMLDIEESKKAIKSYENICDRLNKKPEPYKMWQSINKFIAEYYGIKYTKDFNTQLMRDNKSFPDITKVRREVINEWLFQFRVTGSHKEARKNTKI